LAAISASTLRLWRPAFWRSRLAVPTRRERYLGIWPIACLAVALVVQKFGGTSVGDPDRIREVADHVARCRRRGDDVVLVVSAMGKETDELLRLAAAVSKSRPGREMDMLITGGERKACALVAMALNDVGVPAASYHRIAGRLPHRQHTTRTPRSSKCGPSASASPSTRASCLSSVVRRACRSTAT